MRIFKSNPLLKLVNSYVVDSPQPSNLSFLWNFGSLLAFCLIIQIITGVTLAMHYNANILDAFNSVEHIMRDVNNGWLIRYLHSNTASAFFFIVYLHIGRGLYYGSYKAPRTLVWTIGTVIFILMIATAFLGFLDIAQNGHNLLNIAKLTTTVTIGLTTIKTLNYKSMNKVPYPLSKHNRFNIVQPQNKRYYSTKVSEHSKILTDFIESKSLNPVFVYDNLNESSVKNNILEETKNLSGVYLILNKISLDYYVGSASTGKIYTRLTRHLMSHNGNKVVKNAIKKYKLYSFAFMVLELYPEIISKDNIKNLIDLEDFYLKSLLPNYNILTEAGSSFGFKHSELTRINMKANYSEKRREQIGSLNRRKKLSAATIESIRTAAINRKKGVYSAQSIANMKKSSKPVLVQNLGGSEYSKYSSVK